MNVHEEFEVSVLVTNTAMDAKLLWLSINVPMNADTQRLLQEEHQRTDKQSLRLPAQLEGGIVAHENAVRLGYVSTHEMLAEMCIDDRKCPEHCTQWVQHRSICI